MTMVIDASVAAAWIVQTPYSSAAERILTSGDSLIAPQLIIAELCNTAWKLWRGNHISEDQALQMSGRSFEFLDEVVPLEGLSHDAFKLAMKLDHPAYDCLYLALALARNCQVVTADQKLAKRAAERGLEEFVKPV